MERAKVLYSYSAASVDELTIEVGDIVIVLEKDVDHTGWWKGDLNGTIGVFPGSYVELLHPEEVRH